MQITTTRTTVTSVLETSNIHNSRINVKETKFWDHVDICFLYCMFSFFVLFLQNAIWSEHFFFESKPWHCGGGVSNFVCQLNACSWVIGKGTGLRIWCWVQCDFKGTRWRMFLCVCRRRTEERRSVDSWEHVLVPRWIRNEGERANDWRLFLDNSTPPAGGAVKYDQKLFSNPLKSWNVWPAGSEVDQ